MGDSSNEWVDASIFEGLFQRGLVAGPDFSSKLKRAGYDPADAKPRYPQEVFQRCVEAAVAHFYAGQPESAAHRDLGRRLVDGFSRTLLGSVILAVLPHVPPGVVVNRLPRWFAATSPGSQPRIEEVGPRERRITMPVRPGSSAMPEFLCGVLEKLVKGWTTIEVLAAEPTQTVYRVAWK